MHLMVLLAGCNILQYDETLLARQIFWHIFEQVLQSTVFTVKRQFYKIVVA